MFKYLRAFENSILETTQKNPGMPWHFAFSFMAVAPLNFIVQTIASRYHWVEVFDSSEFYAFFLTLIAGALYEGYQFLRKKNTTQDAKEDMLANLAGAVLAFMSVATF